ncbi:hypothetical protein Lesp02_62220 [Lentzea sp. NBRC 105346]|uniref:hypothetical protein n=1 Tax=Lentzea sp. NBRC 105346 TaxID=3032205 RepID=UPI00255507B9|nr:hypothetical protein [Lentzea sp. NBRC 105346]GLZ34035.1 hypothetical protein Lesp02_62220 [Lentzea sp. NBRC 105346]
MTGNDKSYRWVLAFTGLAMSIVVHFVAIPLLPTAFKLALDQGRTGTYVVADDPACRKATCRTDAGTFTSDDGTIRRVGVRISSNLPKPPYKGDRIRVVDVGDAEVYPDDGEPIWLYPILITLVTFGVTVLALTLLWPSRKKRRDRRTGPA